MRRVILLAAFVLVIAVGVWSLARLNVEETMEPIVDSQAPPIEVVAQDLEIPWEIRFLPNGDLLVTERPGRLVRIGKDKKVYRIDGVAHIGEGGLLGLALDPDFTENNFLYIYLTAREGRNVTNRVERYKLAGDELINRQIILPGIPGASIHDGGRIAFGPDGYLYVTTGEAGETALSQSKKSLGGKILRIKLDGSVPEENPFGNQIYSWGHRNSQGITWDDNGRLWATEHGRSGIASGLDELNLIEKGKNYGWPEIEGDKTKLGMEKPVIHSGADDTWAPAGAVYFEGSIFFGGLRGSALYEYEIASSELKTHFKNQFGRIRAVTLGNDGYLYFSTSNRDGRGKVQANDDKIIRVDPKKLE